MPKSEFTPKDFRWNLKSGRYPSPTAARRAIGKARWSARSKQQAHIDAEQFFQKREESVDERADRKYKEAVAQSEAKMAEGVHLLTLLGCSEIYIQKKVRDVIAATRKLH